MEIVSNVNKPKIVLHVPRGNAPTCPECGNWNALLDKTEHTGTGNDLRIVLYYECRDCGYTVLASDCEEREAK